MNLANYKYDDSGNRSKNTLACPESESSAEAVAAKSGAVVCPYSHEVQECGCLLPGRDPVIGTELRVLLQAVEVGGSLFSRTVEPA